MHLPSSLSALLSMSFFHHLHELLSHFILIVSFDIAGADSSDDFSVELSKDELFAVWDGKVSAVRNSVKVETENGGRPYTLQSLEEMTIFWCEGDAFGDTKQCEVDRLIYDVCV